MDDHTSALEVRELTVHYGKRVAVDTLSLHLAPGEIVAMLGPNGAGKSTSLLAMAGALVPSSGAIRIAGVDLSSDPLAARARIGFADQPPSLYDFFTVSEHVNFVAEARAGGSQRNQGSGSTPGSTNGASIADEVSDLLKDLGLGAITDRFCRELSFGMRQRVGLAAALVGDVNVILLDETLNGLDPRAAKAARDVVLRAAERGVAVLMSTHLLGVAERLCHRIIIMDRGQIKVDVRGDELSELLDRGAGALEALYLETVTSGEAV